MDCHNAKKNLFHFLENKTDALLSGQMEEHLKECSDCHHEYKRLQRIMAQIPALKQDNPNPFLFTRIEQKILFEQGEKQKTFPAFTRVFNPVMVSLLLVATVFTGIYLWGGKSQTIDPVRNEQTTTLAGQYQMNLNNQDLIETYYLTEE